MQVDLTMHRR